MKKPRLTAVGGKDVATDRNAEKFYKEMEVDVLARTLYGEARGEGSAGMQAVANVVLNRVKFAESQNGFWWGNNIIQVCQKPYQFSCWNRSDPNFHKLQAVDKTDLYFATAIRIAQRAAAGVLADITNGATHYHAAGVEPYWARGVKPAAVIGRHIFYIII
jgi:N-acetylmuramoyl-L-alanine amidase